MEAGPMAIAYLFNREILVLGVDLVGRFRSPFTCSGEKKNYQKWNPSSKNIEDSHGCVSSRKAQCRHGENAAFLRVSGDEGEWGGAAIYL